MTTVRKVTLINGDGIGPEVVDATRKILEALKAPLEFEHKDAGAEVANKYGTNLPNETVESVMRNGAGLKGPTATGVGTGQASANVGQPLRASQAASCHSGTAGRPSASWRMILPSTFAERPAVSG